MFINQLVVLMQKLKFLPFYLLSFIPLRLLFVISDISFVFVYYVFRYRRKVVATNLVNSFPDKSQKEIKKIERNFYRHLCDLIVETIKVLTISKKEATNRFHIINKELVEQLYKEQKNVVLYTAHYGNWEWIIFLPLFLSHRVTVLYQPLSNSYFDQLLKLIRSRFGIQCIESSKGYKTLLKNQTENIISLNCIVGDQSPVRNASVHRVRFLNQDTAFSIGADMIAKKSDQTMVFSCFQKLKRGNYEVRFQHMNGSTTGNKKHDIIDEYAQLLEENIIRTPELWLWSHKRWKLNSLQSHNNRVHKPNDQQ